MFERKRSTTSALAELYQKSRYKENHNVIILEAYMALFSTSLCINEIATSMGLLPNTLNCRLRMLRECRERFVRHRGLAILIYARVVMHAGIAN